VARVTCGSHTVLELLQANHNIIVLDNLSNSPRVSLERVVVITGKQAVFIEGDIRNKILLERVFFKYEIDAECLALGNE